MIIYLEGPDGSGKSTLIDNLPNFLHNFREFDNIIVIPDAEDCIPTHPKAENRISEGDLYKKLRRMVKDDRYVYIIDRGPISDIIYRTFDTAKPVTNVKKFAQFVKQYSNKILTIYCRNDVAEQKMLERGDDNPVAIEKHKELTKIYDMFMSMYKMIVEYNVVKYDWTNKQSVSDVYNNIRYFVHMNQKVM